MYQTASPGAHDEREHDPRPREHVDAADLVRALGWLANAARLDIDLDSTMQTLAGRRLRLDTAEGARTVQRCLVDAELPFIWTELRLRDAGRRRPCAIPDHASGAVVVVHGYRWGMHRIRVVLDGRVHHRWLRTSALAQLMGRTTASTVVALAVAPRLPLEPLRQGTDSPWHRARLLLGLDRADIRLAFVYGAAIGILSVVTPVAVQALVNTIAFGALLQPLVVLTALVAVVLTFSGVMRMLQAYTVEAIQARMFVRATADVTRRLFASPVDTVAQASPAELTARFLEIPVLQKAVAILLVDGIDLLLRLLVGMTLLAVYHPTLLLFSAAILLALVLVIVLGGRGAVATALEESKTKYKIVDWLEQTVQTAGVVRSETSRRRALEHADHLARRYRDARNAHFRKLVRQLAGGIAIKVIGSAALLGIGGALVVAGQLTLGQLVAAELVFASIAFALVKLHKQLEAVYDIVASSEKFAGLVDAPLERRGGERLAERGGLRVQLDEVEVTHEGGTVLQDVHLAVAAGEHVGISGAAGSGKSTLLDVVATSLSPTRGRLAFDGQDLRQLALGDLRAHIVVLREGERELVVDTIDANLRLARPEATAQEIDHVLELVGLRDEIGRLPAGFSTELTRIGRPLSGTAVRRLVLARAMLAHPRLLLLDGCLDHLGLPAHQKERLLDALFSRRDTTIIVVSDDREVLARCDRRLETGRRQLTEVA